MKLDLSYNIDHILQAEVRASFENELTSRGTEGITSIVQYEVLMSWIEGVSGFLLSLTILFFLSVLFSRYSKNRREAHVKALQKKYFEFLSELISGDYSVKSLGLLAGDGEITLKLSNQDVTNEFNRSVLKTNLLDLHRFLNGNEKEKLRELYLILGFATTALSHLKSKNPYKRKNAIAELSQMDIREAYDSIFQMINDASEVVRDAAIHARAELDMSPLAMLKELSHPFTPWQQSKVFLQVTSHSQISEDILSLWFSSERNDISGFLLKLIAHFHWDNSISELLKYEQSGRNELRMEVIETLGSFPSGKVKDCLLTAFGKTEIEKEKVVILKAVANMLSREDQNWMLELLQTSGKRITMIVAQLLHLSMDVSSIEVLDENRRRWIQHAANLKRERV